VIDVLKGKYKRGERKQTKRRFPVFPFLIIVVIILYPVLKQGGGSSW
jgi:uncharacterized protein